jgi:hypothetical protein
MLDDDLICKISFRSTELQTVLWIIGVVDKKQLFSPINSFIEVKNYGNKVIGKDNIEEIIIYQEYKSIVVDKNSLAINRPVSMEA